MQVDELATGGVLQVQAVVARVGLMQQLCIAAGPDGKEADLVEEVVRRRCNAGLECHRLPHASFKAQ